MFPLGDKRILEREGGCLKKQKRKWGHRWIGLIGGIIILSCNPIRTPYVSMINHCYATEGASDKEQNSQSHALLHIVNKERMRLGLKVLVKDEKLTIAAMIRASEQQRLFSHVRPDGTPFYTVFSQIGISGNRRGENLARGRLEQYEQIVQAWFKSRGHRENLLRDQFVKVGIGYVEEDNIGYWCMLFAD